MLGPLDVIGPHGSLRLSRRNERVVLTVLVMGAPRVVRAELLCEAIWGDDPPRSARKVLQNIVSRLRKSLGADSIESRSGGYVFVEPDGVIDVVGFEQLIAAARVHAARDEWLEAANDFGSALALWRGPPLADVCEWQSGRAQATRLEELWRCAREEHMAAEVAVGRHHDWLAELELMVTEEPLRERRWSLLAQALFLDDRQADALRAFQRARAALNDVGLDLGPEACELERAISIRDLALRSRAKPMIGAGPHDAGPMRRQLPLRLTSFVGRRTELVELDALIGRARLLTMTGAGGAGKTTLALAVAASADAGADGVYFVDLVPITEEAEVAIALASAVGVRIAGLDSSNAVVDALCEHLAPRDVLLVLDNCEHLPGAAARLSHEILARCPRTTILATSRQPLGVPGEIVYVVAPLSLPARGEEIGSSDAVTLFCERATAANPHLRFTSDEMKSIVTICRRLDGLPLAIELAAARVRMLGVVEIAAALDDCLGFLTDGPRTVAAHHRTLRAAMDWSYGLLPSIERAAFRRLAIFPDTFDLAAARFVVGPIGDDGDDGETCLDGFELMARLVDKSLVVVHQADGRARYRLLEPIRQYAQHMLAEVDDTETATARHDRYFTDQARAYKALALKVRPDQASYRAAMERAWDAGDVNAALWLAMAQMSGFLWVGTSAGVRWLERLLTDPRSTEPRVRAFALCGLVSLLRDLPNGDVDQQRQLLDEAIAIATRAASVTDIAIINFCRSEFELGLGNTAEAREVLIAARHGFERGGAAMSAAWCDDHLGWIAVAEIDVRDATECFERALRTAEREPDGSWLEVHALAALAPLAVLSGDIDHGRHVAEAALTMAARLDDLGLLSMTLVRAAETYALIGDTAWATAALLRLEGNIREQASQRWVADTFETAAIVLEGAQPEWSTTLLGAADALRDATNEQLGGIRAATSEVHRCARRLADTLGPASFKLHWTRGRRQPRVSCLDQLRDLLSRAESAEQQRPNSVRPTSR